MRKLAFALLFSLLAAESLTLDQQVANFMIRYDVDSTTVTYCRMEGVAQNPFGGPYTVPALVKTSGSSTSVTSNTAASGALTAVAARDVMIVRRPAGNLDLVVITAKADNDNVTVDPAVDWSAGFPYAFYKTVCGTTDNDGWVSTAASTRIDMTIEYDQGDLDNLSWRFECKKSAPDSLPVIIYPSEGDGCGNSGTQASGFCDFPTPGITGRFTWTEFGAWSQCRVAFKDKTTDASEAGTNLERVTASIIVSKGQF